MSGLEVSGIDFFYGARQILKGAGFCAGRGELCLLLGANGAGKSTLLRCLNGLLRPRRGGVRLDGQETGGLPLRERARIFGYVPQAAESGARLTVMETVMAGRLPFAGGRLGHADLDRSALLLEQLGLSRLAFRSLADLSGGERQRVLIARALVGEPRVLLLDEPTSSLDLRYQYEVMELLLRVSRERRLPVVAVLHDLNLALDFADRAVLLSQGQVLAQGEPQEVLTPERIWEAYGIRAGISRAEGRAVLLPQRKGRAG